MLSNLQQVQRAGYALTAMRVFNMQSTGRDGIVGHGSIGDMICCLKHYCDVQGLDFDQALKMGMNNYEAETK